MMRNAANVATISLGVVSMQETKFSRFERVNLGYDAGAHTVPASADGGANRRLRVGLLIDNYEIPLWTYRMLERIAAGDYAEISLIVKNEAEPEELNFSQKLKKLSRSFAFALYGKLDRTLFSVGQNAFDSIDLRKLLDVDTISVLPKRTKFSDRLTGDDLKKIGEHEIDVFLRLGFRILRGGILNAARYGVWSFHHGDNEVNRGGPPGLWEVFNGWDDTGVVLQVLTEDLDNGIVLARSHASTDKSSVNRNLNNYYWKALSLVPRKLEELHRSGEKAFFENARKDVRPLKFYSHRLYTVPSNRQALTAMARIAYSKLRQKFSDFFYLRQWMLMFAISQQGELSKTIYRFKKIVPPKDRFWADPHIVQRDGRYYVFVEELLFKTNKGHISVLEIDEKGHVTELRIVLETAYHLSYPFVFEDDGVLYMIPETKANRTIDLYRCVEFPDKWELERTLMRDIEAVDSTVLKKDGKYWLFANVRENPGASIYDELFLFSSDKLSSTEWRPHPLNPIVSDVRKARPAGKIMEIDGELYRPAQDCSKHYGYGMQIFRILQLCEDEYREELVDSIYPNWDDSVVSTHTLSFDSGLTVIDAEVKRSRWR